ncbi:alpha/beta fold hydrolase [Persicitalea sp.]|uniref:alpha/beta fold hydrolase n=1 Tax=Persicitalea sp. TaxID=3100273 RepID=UPI0035936A8C
MNLHYDILGHGPHVLLAFHGVGQTGRRCYEPFAWHLSDYYTIYAFDLFHHGQSSGLNGTDEFSDADVLTKVLWKKLIQNFIQEKKITRFDVVGFSLGGRYALATAEAFPELLNRLILIAPDGVVDHPLFGLATRFPPTRRLYRRLSDNPQPLFAAADLAHRARLLPERMVSFVRYAMGTPEQRRRIYRSWVSLRALSFNIVKLYALWQENGVEVWLFVGKYDPVIVPAKMKVLSRRLPAGHFVILESGHGGLVEKTAASLTFS